jgi:hypothetical protein
MQSTPHVFWIFMKICSVNQYKMLSRRRQAGNIFLNIFLADFIPRILLYALRTALCAFKMLPAF